jgi:hypothetical protein
MGKGDLEIHIDRIDLAAMPGGGERRLREAVARELARAGPDAFAGPKADAGRAASIPEAVTRAVRAGAFQKH